MLGTGPSLTGGGVSPGMTLLWGCARDGECCMLRDDMPTLLQGVRSMRCFVWQDNLALMSRCVRDAVRMERAAGSGDELDA